MDAELSSATGAVPERRSRFLPRGSTLPDAAWRTRHHWMVGLLWAHVLALPLLALSFGMDLTHSVLEGAAVLPFAIAGSLTIGWRRAGVVLVALGLITCSALVVHISGGYIEAHFHFFVMMVLLTLYEDWVPFLLAAAYVLLHHGVLGVLDPEAVYNHGAAQAHPWRWALVHGVFIAAAGAAGVVAWRLNEETRLAQADQERTYRERLEQLNEELRTADQLKSTFLAMASHELRTPLTAISGFAVTMLDRWDTIRDEDKQQYLGVIDGQASRLGRLVDDLLTLSRIESGRMEAAAEPVELSSAIHQVLRDLGGPDAVVNCPPGLGVLADRDHVLQILVNYVANAEKYGASPIRIDATVDQGWVQLAVADCGAGVPDSFVPHLFERFTQADQHAGTDGTGLGLSIVRGLAEAHGGEAWYEPNAPQGSRFSIRLPYAAA